MRAEHVRIAAAAALSTALVGASTPAYACDPFRDACVDRDARWNSAAPSAVVGIGSAAGIASAAGPREWVLGLQLGYVHRPLQLLSPTPSPRTPTAVDALRGAVDTELQFGHQRGRLFLDAALGATVWQDGRGVQSAVGGPEPGSTALRDARVSAQYTIHADARVAVAPRLTLSLPIGTRGVFRTEGSVGASASLLVAAHQKDWDLAAELGARLRPFAESSALGVRTDAQMVAQFGLARRLGGAFESTVSVSLFAAPSLVGQRWIRQSTTGEPIATPSHVAWVPAEAALGAQFCDTKACTWRLTPEVGVALPVGQSALNVAAPWRAAVALSWTP